MDWSSENIISTFIQISQDSKELSVAKLDEKYTEFKESFGKLYEMAIDLPNIQENFEMLKMMLKARDKMKNGSMTKMSTDMFIGNELGKKYIYPITGTPTVQDYERASKKIKKKAEKEAEED